MQSRLISGLCLVLSFLCSFAQRVNEHGLKMVSEIEVFDLRDDRDCSVKFEYNSKGNLIGTKCYGYNFDTEKFGIKNEYRLTNGRLYYKDYEEGGNVYKYDFELDWNNHITRKTETATAGQDVGSKWEWNYSYEFSPLSNEYYISKVIRREWNTNTQTKTYVFLNEACVGEYELSEGCVLNKGKQYVIDKSQINDTNLSLLDFFIYGLRLTHGHYLSLTEWMGFHNRYMPDTDDSKYYKYEYLYDKDGNLSEVRLYGWGKWEKLNGNYGWGIKKSIKLTYLY